jgi:hypothetical protein
MTGTPYPGFGFAHLNPTFTISAISLFPYSCQFRKRHAQGGPHHAMAGGLLAAPGLHDRRCSPRLHDITSMRKSRTPPSCIAKKTIDW